MAGKAASEETTSGEMTFSQELEKETLLWLKKDIVPSVELSYQLMHRKAFVHNVL